MAQEIEQRRGKHQMLDDALSMERDGLVALHTQDMGYRQACLLVLISNRLKEVTERLMEVEGILKEERR